MFKNILLSGILGGVVMFVVFTAVRILLPSVGYPVLQALPGQVPIHAQLKEQITKPGTYVCPYMTPEEAKAFFPDYWNEPVFVVTYRGGSHSTVPGFASLGMLAFLLAPLAAAWLLSQASDKVLATYLRRVLFVGILGILVLVTADLMRSLTDELPFALVAGRALVSVITWVLIGIVLAWRIKPVSIGA